MISNVEVVVHNTFLHAFDLDDDYGLTRSVSAPAGCNDCATHIPHGHLTQHANDPAVHSPSDPAMQDSSPQCEADLNQPGTETYDQLEMSVSTQRLAPETWHCKSGRRNYMGRYQTKASSASDDCRADVPGGCSRNASPLSTISTSASSDELACDQQESEGTLQASRLPFLPWVTSVATTRTTSSDIDDSMVAMCAGVTQEAWTASALMTTATIVPISMAACTAPSNFLSASGPNILSAIASDPSVLGSSRPLQAQDMATTSTMRMTVAEPGTAFATGCPQVASGLHVPNPGPVTLMQLPTGVVPEAVGSAPSCVRNAPTTSRGQPPDPATFNASQHCNVRGGLLQLAHASKRIFGSLHHFHEDTLTMGWLSADARQFTKMKYEGRLSIVTENQVHSAGLITYAVQFTAGEMSSADGVGFIFSPKLPSTKNIQKIVSIFANSAGRICLRAGAEVVRSGMSLQPLKLGDWIELTLDLKEQVACFRIHSPHTGQQSPQVSFAFGDILKSLKNTIHMIPEVPCGYLACVVKNVGVTVKLGS